MGFDTCEFMRFLFFIDNLSSGGKERRLIELIKGLIKEKYVNFELVVLSDTIHYKEIFDFGLTIHKIVRKSKRDLTVFSQVYKICKNYKPDFVHCWDSMSAIYLIPSSILLGFKIINGMVSDAPDIKDLDKILWWRARFTFLFSKLIIGNSLAGLTAYKAPVRKSICIKNGFNFNRTHQLVDREQVKNKLGIKTPFIVGMVATNSKYKDYTTFFKAAQKILNKRSDVTFIAIGVDTEKLTINGHDANILLLGKRSDIEELINCFDVGTLSTYTEGISNSILEYMALAKPVIASGGGGTPEIVEDGKTGFLIPVRSPQILADKIDLLLNNQNLRLNMGKAGNFKIRNEFSIEKMINEYLIQYRNLVNN